MRRGRMLATPARDLKPTAVRGRPAPMSYLALHSRIPSPPWHHHGEIVMSTDNVVRFPGKRVPIREHTDELSEQHLSAKTTHERAEDLGMNVNTANEVFWRMFGENMRAIRFRLNLTPEQMAQDFGVSIATYMKWEAGNRARPQHRRI